MTNSQPDPLGHRKTLIGIIVLATMSVTGSIVALIKDTVVGKLFQHYILSFIIDKFSEYGWTFVIVLLVILLFLAAIVCLGGAIVYVSSLGLGSTITKLTTQIQDLRNQHEIIGGKVNDLNTINEDMKPGVVDVRRFIKVAPLAAGDRVGLLSTDLIVLPIEYCERIRSMRKNPTPPVGLIFMGSMVGFTYTLARELGRFAAEKYTSLSEIISIGPHCEKPDAIGSNLVWPVWNFQLTVLRTFLERLLEVGYNGKHGNLTFKSYYMPFDILSAAIFVPDEYVIVLEALSVEMLEIVAKKGECLIGRKYNHNDTRSAVYSRFNYAIASYKKYQNVVHDKVTITYSEPDGNLTISADGISLPIKEVQNRFIDLEYLAKRASGEEPFDLKTLTFPRKTQKKDIEALIKELSEGLKTIEIRSIEVKMLNEICRKADSSFG